MKQHEFNFDNIQNKKESKKIRKERHLYEYNERRFFNNLEKLSNVLNSSKDPEKQDWYESRSDRQN